MTNYDIPNSIIENEKAYLHYTAAMNAIYEVYCDLIKYGISHEDAISVLPRSYNIGG